MKKLQIRLGADAGRPEHDRGSLANAFVAKAVLGISTTSACGTGDRNVGRAVDWAYQRLRLARSRSKETRRRNLRLLSQRNRVVQAEVREAKAGKRELQRGKPLVARLKALPHECDWGKCNAQRDKKRSQAARTKVSLKDDYGGRFIRVRGNSKVMSHRMFGMLSLTTDPLMRLLT